MRAAWESSPERAPMIIMRMGRVPFWKEESSFSEEKEAKRLLSAWARTYIAHRAQSRKSFLVLFFKKEHLP
jgi:hypothetical protein